MDQLPSWLQVVFVVVPPACIWKLVILWLDRRRRRQSQSTEKWWRLRCGRFELSRYVKTDKTDSSN